MENNFVFKGTKGCRQVVKTIDIHEESYNALKKMLSSGRNMTDDICAPLIGDAYKIFGGNCYDMLVSMAVEHFIVGVVYELENKGFLSVDGSIAFEKITDALFPLMCYTKDDDDDLEEALRFFEVNADEVIQNVTPCLAVKQQQVFLENLKAAVKDDNRPVGEIALGILIFMSSDTCEEKSELSVN